MRLGEEASPTTETEKRVAVADDEKGEVEEGLRSGVACDRSYDSCDSKRGGAHLLVLSLKVDWGGRVDVGVGVGVRGEGGRAGALQMRQDAWAESSSPWPIHGRAVVELW